MSYLVVHQSRSADPTPYEMKLAGSMEEVFGRGDHSLEALIAGLNDLGIPGPDGKPWTAEMFTHLMARLGA